MIANLQALRALAAYLVVVVHLQTLLSLAGAPDLGNGGVDVFFVISGYIMVHVTRRAPTTPGRFMRNRVARIAPLYWVLTGATFVAALIAPQLFKNTSADPVDLLLSLAFVPFQKADVGGPQPVLFVGWTLNYEMFFYALFAVGLVWRKGRTGTLVVIGLLLALVIVGTVLRPQSTLGAFYTRPLILEFGAGMVLGLVLPHRSAIVSVWAPRGALAAALIALAALATPPPQAMEHALWYGPPAVLLVAASLALERWGWRVANPVVMRLGDASYSIYLTHVFVTVPLTMLGVRWGLSGVAAAVLAAGAALVATAVGLTVHMALEKPLSGHARRLLIPVPRGLSPAEKQTAAP